MAAATLELAGERATRKAGEILGELLREQPIGKTAFVLGLEGELGAGKTTFVRGLAKGLGILEKFTSPSFLIAKRYEIPPLRQHRRSFGLRPQDDGGRVALWHFDFYRFHRCVSKRDLALLNLPDILRDSNNIIAIEWAERVRRFLPKNRLAFHFEVMGHMQRRLVITGRS